MRLFRYLQSIRNSISPPMESKRSRKLREDQDLYVTSSSSSLSNSSSSQMGGSNSGGGGSAAGEGGRAVINAQTSQRMIEVDAFSACDLYTHFMESGRRPYFQFQRLVKSSLHMYFNALQLYPLDISFYFRPSQAFRSRMLSSHYSRFSRSWILRDSV